MWYHLVLVIWLRLTQDVCPAANWRLHAAGVHCEAPCGPNRVQGIPSHIVLTSTSTKPFLRCVRRSLSQSLLSYSPPLECISLPVWVLSSLSPRLSVVTCLSLSLSPASCVMSTARTPFEWSLYLSNCSVFYMHNCSISDIWYLLYYICTCYTHCTTHLFRLPVRMSLSLN